MKFVVVSDLHLDAITDGVHRGPEIAAALDVAVEYAIKHRAGFMCLGDISDPMSPRSIWAMSKCVEASSMLAHHEVPQIWLPGNHDVLEDGTGEHTMMPIAALENELLHVPHRPSIAYIGSLTVMCLPFTPVANNYDPAEFVANCALTKHIDIEPDVIIGHLNMHGITGGSESTEYARGRDVFWPIDAIRTHYPRALLLGGHYHDRQVFDGVQIVGSMARLTYGEAEIDPGFLVVEV